MKYLLIILTVLPLMASADEPAHLGRLFFTPSERSNLDILRQNSKAPDKVIKADEISKDDDIVTDGTSSASNPVIMNGYVRRSDGKNTLWVNDRAVTETSASKDFSVGRLNKDQVRISVNSKSANLKPGQVYDPNTGKIYNHLSEATQSLADEETKPESMVDTVSKKLGLDELKSKVSELIDSWSAKPDATAASDDK
jgi:hypothetical protein